MFAIYMAMTPYGWEPASASHNEARCQVYMETLKKHLLYQGVKCDIYRVTADMKPTLVHTFVIPRPTKEGDA